MIQKLKCLFGLHDPIWIVDFDKPGVGRVRVYKCSHCGKGMRL